jgi:hypothetical protein
VGLLDSPLRSVSSKLIRKFGKDIVIRLNSTGAFDETTDSAAVSEVDVPVKAIVSDYKRASFDGRIKSGDKQVLVAAMDFSTPPDEESEVFIDGSKHQVILVTQITATEEAAVYEITARGV